MNTDNNQETSKNGVIKTLAIIGLIAIIVLAVWASVQIVRIIPSAFSSLASVADTIYNNRPVDTLSVALEKSIVNVGDSVALSWTDLEREGDYSFYFTCTDGVSIEARTNNGKTTLVQCDTPLSIPKESTTIDLTIASEQSRFVDVPLTIAFTPVNEEESLFERNSRVTVVNPSIPQSADVAAANGETPLEENDASDASPDRDIPGDPEAVADREIPGADETETESHTPLPQSSGSSQSAISYIPKSYEEGFVDLKMTYLGVGTLEGTTFVPSGSIDSDDRGAFRFEVKNIGTKTSDEWAFEATLPTGFVFKSEDQVGLKPNEKAVFTLGFDPGDSAGNKSITGSVDAPNDTKASNDSFNWTVTITD